MAQRGTKRGISPVIATMILVSLALLLAVIIFLWARAFLGERVQKDIGGGYEPIESFCDDVNFEVEAFDEGTEPNRKSDVRVVNRGNVPLHGLEIREKGQAQIKSVGTFNQKTIKKGEDASIQVYQSNGPDPNAKALNDGTTLSIAPIILGEKGTQYDAHVCDREFAREAIVQ